nr:hypothetical protein Q903MT_gene2141 [Picea sitchensis]
MPIGSGGLQPQILKTAGTLYADLPELQFLPTPSKNHLCSLPTTSIEPHSLTLICNAKIYCFSQ